MISFKVNSAWAPTAALELRFLAAFWIQNLGMTLLRARSKNGVAIGIDIFGKTLINGNEIGDSAIDSGADNDKVIGRGNSRTRTAFGIEINGGKSILVLLMTGLQAMEKVGVVMPMALR